MTTQGAKDGTPSSLWLAVERVGLPDKKYFKIGEVAQLVGVEPHVLRYWQTQFPQVRPQKSRSGHRLYRRKDVETLLLVRELLHVQRFTIAGARQALRGVVRGERGTTGLPAPAAERETHSYPPPRPFAEPPRAVATEVACVEVEGLDDDELDDALSQQLTAARSPAGYAALDVEDDDDRDDGSDDVTEEEALPLVAAAGRSPPLQAHEDGVQAHQNGAQAHENGAQAHGYGAQARGNGERVAPPPDRVRAAGALASGSGSAGALAPSSSGAAAVVATSSSSRSTATATVSARARKEQLGFGFVPPSRGSLEAARVDVLAVLELLDRDDAAANRLRARPVAAKS